MTNFTPDQIEVLEAMSADLDARFDALFVHPDDVSKPEFKDYFYDTEEEEEF